MKLHIKGIWQFLLLTFTCQAISSCGEDVDSLYANWHVGFVYNQVNTTEQIRSALTNPGEFCLINFPNGKYHFLNSEGKELTYTPTATAAGYAKPYGFLSGIVVGTPAVPDLKGQTTVAYDLACPNCSENYSITRALNFSTNTTLTCSRCKCTYDLNAGGNESNGKSRALYRYRTVQYSVATSTVSITN